MPGRESRQFLNKPEFQVGILGNDIELDTVGRQFEPYQWRPVTWDSVPEQLW